jgi:hypothetical protein
LRHFALLIPFLIAAVPAGAQRRGPDIAVVPLPANSPPRGASVQASGLLGGAKIRELMRSGFPAALSYRLELWRTGGIFNELESTTAWNVLVRYDPYSQQYLVVRRQGASLVEDFGGFPSLQGAEAVLAKPFQVALPARRGGARYYYNLVVDIEALSVSDLDELERWLRGELRPAVRGKRAPIPALRRGIGTLLSRVLGGETLHFEARSGTFRT